MSVKFGPWKTATIDIDRATEFTGDDVDQYSDVVNLGGDFEFLLVHYDGAITSSAVTVYGQKTDSITEVPVPTHGFLDADGDATVAQATTGATTQISVVLRIGAYQFIRLRATSNQSADETFSVRGFNR